MESFIEHQDACNMGHLRPESQLLQPAACLSRTASSPSPSSETNFSVAPWPSLMTPRPVDSLFLTSSDGDNNNNNNNKNNPSNGNGNPPPKKSHYYNLELQLSTSPNPVSGKEDENHSTQLQLSIGSSDFNEKNESSIINLMNKESPRECNTGEKAARLKEEARQQLRLAMAEKVYAEEARQQAKRQIELAEKEFSHAKRIRQQAQAELDKAQALKEHARKQINSTILQITCHACKQQFRTRAAGNVPAPPDENSLVLSYMSSAITEGEVVEINHRNLRGAKTTNP